MIKVKLLQNISTRNIHNFMKPFQDSAYTYIIEKGNRSAKATSMINLLALDLQTGDEINIAIASGEKSETYPIIRKLYEYIKKVEE